MHITSLHFTCEVFFIIDRTNRSPTIFNKQYYHWAIQAMDYHSCKHMNTQVANWTLMGWVSEKVLERGSFTSMIAIQQRRRINQLENDDFWKEIVRHVYVLNFTSSSIMKKSVIFFLIVLISSFSSFITSIHSPFSIFLSLIFTWLWFLLIMKKENWNMSRKNFLCKSLYFQ